MKSLQDEIDKRAREIHTDRYSMSISEAAAMYADSELEIHPEFQRIFRWSLEQQSRLIESIFLGIPVPPIFVAQQKTAYGTSSTGFNGYRLYFGLWES